MTAARFVAAARRLIADRRSGVSIMFGLGLALGAVMLVCGSRLRAQTVTREQAARSAIHPVASSGALRAWLARVPVTREFPPDFAETLRGQAPLFALEMSTSPGCVPCAASTGTLEVAQASWTMWGKWRKNGDLRCMPTPKGDANRGVSRNESSILVPVWGPNSHHRPTRSAPSSDCASIRRRAMIAFSATGSSITRSPAHANKWLASSNRPPEWKRTNSSSPSSFNC